MMTPNQKLKKNSIEPQEIRNLILTVMDDKKAQDVLCLDLRDRNSFVDFMVIACGTSAVHVNEMADSIRKRIHEKYGFWAFVNRGEDNRWVVLDALAVMVHMMHPQVRAFYQLEELWQQPPSLE